MAINVPEREDVFPPILAARQEAARSWTGIGDALRGALLPLASLKLTVALLVISVFVVFVATLEQTESDIWTVKHRHYSNLLVVVPIQVFFPPDWFPQWQQVPGSIVIPSGLTMLVALIVNLVAAHLFRMRVQARGGRLIAGACVLAAGVAISWLIVFGAQNPEGFQGQPPVSYEVLWQAMQVGMIALALGGIGAATLMSRQRALERMIVGALSVLVLAVFGFTLSLGEKTFIGDSGMRVLWQLLQATFAALVLLTACVLLFKRKGGIVLIHLGIGLLMANEVFVTTTNIEQQLRLLEGETSWHTIDIRETELVVAEEKDADQVCLTVIPGRLLSDGSRIRDGRLPFEIEVLRYLPNAEIVRLSPGETSLATEGLGRRFAAREIAPFTDRDHQVNFAAAYVKLWDAKSGLALGSYLLSQAAYEQKLMEAVAVGGTTYRLALRFRHYYKPYSVTLVDAQRELYLGTDRPRWFASEILINDPAAGLVDYPQRVWMNNPMRYRDETFYQTQWSVVSTPEGPKESSVLQIVKNRGWMIPYLACMIVVVGLLTQFGTTLLQFLEKKGTAPSTGVSPTEGLRSARASSGSTVAGDATENVKAWILTGVAAVVCLGYLGMEWKRGMASVRVKDQIDLTRWGQLPINFGARVQPIDSLARNTARQLSNYERVVDKYGVKQPAIRWFADWIYEANGHDEYAILRITDLSVLDALGLEHRRRFRYSIADLNKAGKSGKTPLQSLVELTDELIKTDRDQLSTTQKRLIDLRVSLNRLSSLRRAFTNPYQQLRPDDILGHLELANKLAREDHLPRIVPDPHDPDQPWRMLTHLWTERWLDDFANKCSTRSLAELVSIVTEREVMGPLRERMVRERMIDEVLADPIVADLVREQLATEGLADVRKRLLANWSQFPATVYEQLYPRVAPAVDQLLAEHKSDFRSQVDGLIRDPLKWTGDQIPSFENAYALAWMKMGEAYRNEPQEFNAAVETVERLLAASHPVEYRPFKVRTEYLYHAFAPLYQATALYLLAFILTVLAWVFWPRAWNRAATSVLLIGLAVHLAAIVMRVIISGRPPVTNLYSSFVFVPLIGVAVLMVIERFTRLGIANGMAALAGAASLLWAWSITVSDRNATGDTFTVMEAVLDTQFWLSTHVIMICLGYGGTIAAGLLGAGYLVAGVATRSLTGQREKRLAGTIYGTLCFALLCSFFGTVLGGLWADDSWGRFWGWDPKENGALMIVLWNAVSLHARWGGIVRHRGLAGLAVVGSIVTIWSWEGVNQLGQGLHAYGFSKDRLFGVGVFVAVHIGLAALALIPQSYWRSQNTVKV